MNVIVLSWTVPPPFSATVSSRREGLDDGRLARDVCRAQRHRDRASRLVVRLDRPRDRREARILGRRLAARGHAAIGDGTAVPIADDEAYSRAAAALDHADEDDVGSGRKRRLHHVSTTVTGGAPTDGVRVDEEAVEEDLDGIIAADLEGHVEARARRVLEIGEGVDDVVIHRIADVLGVVHVDEPVRIRVGSPDGQDALIAGGIDELVRAEGHAGAAGESPEVRSSSSPSETSRLLSPSVSSALIR